MEILEFNNSQKFIIADVLLGLEYVPNNSIDLSIIDFPYFKPPRKSYEGNPTQFADLNSHVHWATTVIDKVIPKLKQSGSLYVFAGQCATPYLQIYLTGQLILKNFIVWERGISSGQSLRKFNNIWEPLLFYVVNEKKFTFNKDAASIATSIRKRGNITHKTTSGELKLYNTMKVSGDVFNIPAVKPAAKEFISHPNQKPEKLIRQLVDVSSNEGDLILDVFSGSGTSARVAQLLNRRCISIEQSKAYVLAGIQRLNL